MRTSLRTAIAVALVTGVAITAPALTTGAAFAAGTNPTPAPTATVTASPAPKVTATTAATATATVTASPAPTATVTATATASPAPTATATAAASEDAPVRTVRLAGGLSAKVYAKGDQHPYYTATVVKGGRTLGELKAGAGYGGKDTEVFAGYSVTLTADGEVTATEAGATPAPAPEPGPVVTLGPCTVQQDIPSVFALLTVTLTNDLEEGPKAVLKDEAGKPIVTVDRAHPGDTGAGLMIKGAGTTTPQVGQRTQGGAVPYRWTAFPKLPKGCEKDDSASGPKPGPVVTLGKCTVVTTVGIGAGTAAELTMSPNGPKATFRDAGDNTKVFETLDRNHPSLPKSAGIVARIDNPFSAAPSLYTKVEGGVGSKGGSHAFPELPKGCELNPVKGATAGSGKGTSIHAGQTSVIPQGGVAAGAELGEQDGDTALLAAGAGASFAAAGLGFVVLRRRTAASRV
ncbi:hypothetical protein [Streptomyces sp. NPDC058718]|uniref:hypothetical protein n=1 Tax=Streptomyces sp. NPDC058718 TaxID=3346610 RepID=UPI0036A02150